MTDQSKPDRQDGEGLSREQVLEYIRELNTIAAECEIAGTSELSRAAHNLYRIAKRWFKSLPVATPQPRDAAEGAKFRSVLQQIKIVCVDNAATTIRHDLALEFVGSIAARALATIKLPVITEDDGSGDPLPDDWKPPIFNQPSALPKPAPDAMREALESFAKAAEAFDSWPGDMKHEDAQNICTFIPHSGKLEDAKTINYGHCRKARVALSAPVLPADGPTKKYKCPHCGEMSDVPHDSACGVW